MRIELENNDPPKEEMRQTKNPAVTFAELSGRKKAGYIWDYYKWWIIGAVIAVIAVCVFIRDYRENSKPTYLYVEMLNSYLGIDISAANTLRDDFVKETGINLEEEHLTIGCETTLDTDTFDTTMLAYQQRLIANYTSGELDAVIGPVEIMEGPANCDDYADFNEIIPEKLMDELIDRGYELYYFDPSADEIEDYEGEDLTPYCAGIYLDDCAYLNNIGENGAYPVAEAEGSRVIFTIAANSGRKDHAIEFLKFIALNR